MQLNRRTFSAGMLGLLGAGALHAQAQAQSGPYPNRAIRLVVPLAPGSAVDNASRVLGQSLSQTLGQSVVIENVAGSAGMIGASRVARATPDGYTLGAFNDSILTMVPHINKNVSWDALEDFAPVSIIGTIEWGVVVNANAPYQNLQEFIAAAKAAPNSINYSSGGNGSPQHLAMEIFSTQAGISMTHVPYKGATPAGVAVASGEVEIGFQSLSTVIPMIKSGNLRLLAVSSPQRLGQFEQTPTVQESGLADFSFNSWCAIVAPRGTPQAIIDELHRAIGQALQDQQVQQQLSAQGLTPTGTTPEEFAASLREQYARYEKVIRDNHISVE